MILTSAFHLIIFDLFGNLTRVTNPLLPSYFKVSKARDQFIQLLIQLSFQKRPIV